MGYVIPFLLGLVPVFLFLASLILLDSFKLVTFRSILVAVLVGFAAAAASFLANTALLTHLPIEGGTYSRYVAPFVEEFWKAAYLIYLVASKRTGFMVDAAIYGFAIGAGFAAIENIYFLNALSNPDLVIWFVRGLGTAVMHGGTTAILAIVSQGIAERGSAGAWRTFLPGLAIAMIIHSTFNHFILPPIVSTAVLVIFLPVFMMAAFRQSEASTRQWLGVGLDTDVELMQALTDGSFSESHIGQYLKSLRENFRGEIVADMLCLIRIRTELAIKAKAMLMMKEAGFNPEPDPELQDKFTELKYLEKSIGRTGQLAIAPVLHTSNRDLWQLQMLGQP